MDARKTVLKNNLKKTHNPVPISFLAKKYACSRSYVSKVLKTNSGETILARKIIKDANDIRAVLERETVITI